MTDECPICGERVDKTDEAPFTIDTFGRSVTVCFDTDGTVYAHDETITHS